VNGFLGTRCVRGAKVPPSAFVGSFLLRMQRLQHGVCPSEISILRTRVFAYSADLRPRLCLKSGLCWLYLKGDRQEKKQGRTRGSHSKCERRIWVQTSGASHAYTLMQLPILWTCNCFSLGLRPLLRCFGAAFWRSLFVSDIKLAEPHV
jgi:hypothetical protein